MIYADNAATTPLDKDAFEAMKPYWWDDFGNPSQLYSLSRSPKSALKSARETIANCIGADPDEIYFTSCGTESDNWVIKEIGCVGSNEIITSEIEHHAILNSCAAVERMGCTVKIYFTYLGRRNIREYVTEGHIQSNQACFYYDGKQ